MAVKKVVKKGDEKPSDLETAVGQALVDLETHSKDLKADLKDLYIVGAKEVEAEARKCIIVMVPYVQKQAYNKIQNKLIRELEKKFSGKHVFLIAQRTIFSPAYSRKNGGALRPRSRTLTTVHDGILQDIVHPIEIVGKRTRVRVDGSKLLKIFLDPKEQGAAESKLRSYAAVYKKLTNKNVEFSFPIKN